MEKMDVSLIRNEEGFIQFPVIYDSAIVGITTEGNVVYEQNKLEELLQNKYHCNALQAAYSVKKYFSDKTIGSNIKDPLPVIYSDWRD